MAVYRDERRRRKHKAQEKKERVLGSDVGNGIVVSIRHDSVYGYLALTRRQMTITDRFNIKLPRPMSHEEIKQRVWIAFGILPNPITSKLPIQKIMELGVEEYEKRKG